MIGDIGRKADMHNELPKAEHDADEWQAAMQFCWLHRIKGLTWACGNLKATPPRQTRGGLTETGRALGKQVTGGDNDLRSNTCG